MPLMIEDDMDGLGGPLPNINMNMDDDLFGDEVLPMPHEHRPPSKQLQQRLDELRSHGCCRTVAYSKQGIIASVSPDGTQVILQCPQANHCDGSWELGEPLACSLLQDALPGTPITHLAWAPTPQPELAVIDAFGRVCLLNLTIHANKAQYVSRKWDADVQDDLHSIVGCCWLPLQLHPQRPFSLVWGAAVKNNDKYSYDNHVFQGFGPCHPNASKSSFVCVTSGGTLKLFFTQNSNQIQDIHLEMESITLSDDVITHAAICSERGKLLIVLATAAKQMKVISAEINWGVAQLPQDKQNPPGGSLLLRPSLKIDHVTTTSWLQEGLVDSYLDASMDQISHLELLPLCFEVKTRTTTPAMILAVRSYIPTADSHYNMECQSVIDGWDVVTDQPQQLHPAFEQRGSKAGAASSPSPLVVLHKRNSIVVNKVVISIETSLYGKIVCIGFSDGTVQYRDRYALAELITKEELTPILVPRQAGFHFAEEVPSLQTTFSPNLGAFAQMCENGAVIWNNLQYPVGQIGSGRQDPFFNAVLGSVTTAIANAAPPGINHDDILAIARPIVDEAPGFLREWVTNLVNMIPINLDYSDESVQGESLLRNVQWQLALGILNHFGFKGWFRPRSFSGKLTMLSLSLRIITMTMSLASHSPASGPARERIVPMDEPEVVNMLSGCAQWSVDLLSWVTDGLFALRDDQKFKEILKSQASFSGMTKYLKERNDVFLHLVLSSTTRCLLSTLCRRVTRLQSTCQKAQDHYMNVVDRPESIPGPALQRAYMKLQRAATTNLVKIDEFEALLAAIGMGVRQTYQTQFADLSRHVQQQQQQQQQQQSQAKPGHPLTGEQAVKKAMAQCELIIFFGEQPPQGFQSFVRKLFETELGTIMRSTQRFDLFFTDFPVLEVEDRPKQLAARKTDAKFVDVFKRVEFSAPSLMQGSVALKEQSGDAAANSTYRKCVRCCAIMEDLPPTNSRPGYNYVLSSSQRRCICGGQWVSFS